MFANSSQRLGLAVAAILAYPASGFACDQYDAVVAAVQANDVSTAMPLFEEISTNASCDDAIREWVGDFLARESFITAMDSETEEPKRKALLRALGYETHWRSYTELGRVDWNAKRYAPAAASFQLAINELIDGDPTHEATESEIADLYQLATASLALAEIPVEMPKTRSGEAGGIFRTKIRGFSVEEVSLPITFEFDSVTFDEAGESYASALAEHLLATGAVHVRLMGHTDPTGTEEYNLSLSEARANAVGEFLRSHGMEGKIEVSGLGEDQLPEPPDGIEPGSEEHFRIARRVVFSIN